MMLVTSFAQPSNVDRSTLLQRPFSKISSLASAMAGFLQRRVVVATGAVTSDLAPAPWKGARRVSDAQSPSRQRPLDGA
jgi:hypothetical protein